jgi:hypothetical protein
MSHGLFIKLQSNGKAIPQEGLWQQKVKQVAESRQQQKKPEFPRPHEKQNEKAANDTL